MKKGFTLLELIVVLIIIGILGSIGFTQYARLIERGRTAEAKSILGQVRSAQEAYKLEYGYYAGAAGGLAVDVPASCSVTHYFSYAATNTTGTATRCTSGGKTPQDTSAYTITITYSTGTWGGSAGYY